MIGVKGWFWANQLRPSGIVSVGTKALLRKGRRTRKIGRLLAVSTSFGHMPRATENHEMASAARARTPTAAIHSAGPVVGRKPISTATIVHDGECQERLDHAADDVAGEDRRPADGHRPESVDDPFGHVHRHRQRRALGGAGHGDQQDARQDVGGVCGSPAGRGRPGPPRASRPGRTRRAAGRRPGCRR